MMMAGMMTMTTMLSALSLCDLQEHLKGVGTHTTRFLAEDTSAHNPAQACLHLQAQDCATAPDAQYRTVPNSL